MKEILTDDGSVTVFSEKYDQTYHNYHGAAEESFEKFAKPCSELFSKSKLKILDICFGIGYNTAALMDLYSGELVIDAFEIDPEIILKMFLIKTPFKSYDKLKSLVKGGKFEDATFKLHMGDVQEKLHDVADDYDIVFLDAFSEKTCPELWTEEFMKLVFSKMKKGGILTTYACARKVRDNLRAAGFAISNGPEIGRRGPSTIAKKE